MEEEKHTTKVSEANEIENGNKVHTTSVTKSSPTSGVVIFQRVVWYITGAILILLLMRFVLQLLGANDTAAFVSFIYTVSNIFAAPFYGIFSYQPSYGSSYLELSTLVAIIVYAVVGWGVAKLVTLTRPREEV